jgi:hypothetical protein
MRLIYHIGMFTQYDLNLLGKIIDDFPAFLYTLEFDEPADTIKALLSDERFIEIPRYNVDIVEAWVSWNLTMRPDTYIMWQAGAYSDAVMRRGRVMNMTEPLGPIHDEIAIRSRQLEYKASRSRGIFFKASETAGRGLSLHHLIIEGVQPQSDLWTKIIQYTAPCLFSGNAKLITIV